MSRVSRAVVSGLKLGLSRVAGSKSAGVLMEPDLAARLDGLVARQVGLLATQYVRAAARERSDWQSCLHPLTQQLLTSSRHVVIDWANLVNQFEAASWAENETEDGRVRAGLDNCASNIAEVFQASAEREREQIVRLAELRRKSDVANVDIELVNMFTNFVLTRTCIKHLDELTTGNEGLLGHGVSFLASDYQGFVQKRLMSGGNNAAVEAEGYDHARRVVLSAIGIGGDGYSDSGIQASYYASLQERSPAELIAIRRAELVRSGVALLDGLSASLGAGKGVAITPVLATRLDLSDRQTSHSPAGRII